MADMWRTVSSRPGYCVSLSGLARTPRGKLCRPSVSNGYLVINAGGIVTGIHRMVAEAFVPNPGRLPCVNHIDGNKLNNDPSNLEWCTKAHNTRHAFRTGLIRSPKGEGNPFARLTEADIRVIRDMFASGMSASVIAEIYGMCGKSMRNIRSGKTWSHVQ